MFCIGHSPKCLVPVLRNDCQSKRALLQFLQGISVALRLDYMSVSKILIT